MARCIERAVDRRLMNVSADMDIKPQGIDRLIRMDELVRITGMTPSVIYREIRNGAFPAQVAIHGRAVAWFESDIAAWMEGLKNPNSANQS